MNSAAAFGRKAASLALICACASVGAGCVSGSAVGGKKIGAFRGVAQLPPDLLRAPAPAIDLADARGGHLTTASLRGRPYAVTFLYTRCPDVCPLIGTELHTALSQMGAKANRVAVVGVRSTRAGTRRRPSRRGSSSTTSRRTFTT